MKKIWKYLATKVKSAGIGFWIALKEEKSLWALLFIGVILIGLGIWVSLSFLQWALVALIFFLVYAIEMINTALETAVDTISFQYNVKVKKIKDIASAATLVITTGALVSLLFIYIPAIQGALS